MKPFNITFCICFLCKVFDGMSDNSFQRIFGHFGLLCHADKIDPSVNHLCQNGTSIFYACQIAKITTRLMKGVIIDDRTLSEGNSVALRGMRTDVQRVLFPAGTVLRLSPHGTRALGSSSACGADDATQGLGYAESGCNILACDYLACLLVSLFQSKTSQHTG